MKCKNCGSPYVYMLKKTKEVICRSCAEKWNLNELDKERLDHDPEYRKEMLNYLFAEVKELIKINDGLSQKGEIKSEVLLNKLSNVEKDLKRLKETA